MRVMVKKYKGGSQWDSSIEAEELMFYVTNRSVRLKDESTGAEVSVICNSYEARRLAYALLNLANEYDGENTQ